MPAAPWATSGRGHGFCMCVCADNHPERTICQNRVDGDLLCWSCRNLLATTHSPEPGAITIPSAHGPEIDPTSARPDTDHAPARPLPPMVALQLADAVKTHDGFYAYCHQAAGQGFALSDPSDHDLTDHEWETIASMRVRTLLRAYRMSQR